MHFLTAPIPPGMTNWWPGGGGGEAPDLRPGLEEADVSPGIAGFLFTALVVFLLLFVVRDMAKRVRRMKYRSQVEAELAGEEPEFPGEITPAQMGDAQQRARDAAAADRFGDSPAPVRREDPAEPSDDGGAADPASSSEPRP